MFRFIRSACLTACIFFSSAWLPISSVSAIADENFGLPADVGREEVVSYCGACHSIRLVVQQGLTREGWAELLEWMYEEQEMESLDAEDETLVLDYLAKHVDPESQKQRLRSSGILN